MNECSWNGIPGSGARFSLAPGTSASTGSMEVAGSVIKSINPDAPGDLIIRDGNTTIALKNIYAFDAQGQAGNQPSRSASNTQKSWNLQLRDRRWLWSRTDPVSVIANLTRGGKVTEFDKIKGTETVFDNLSATYANLIGVCLKKMGENPFVVVPNSGGRPLDFDSSGKPAGVLLGELCDAIGIDVCLNLHTNIVYFISKASGPSADNTIPGDNFLIADQHGTSINPKPKKIIIVGARTIEEVETGECDPVGQDPSNGEIIALSQAVSKWGVTEDQLAKGAILDEPFSGMTFNADAEENAARRNAAIASYGKWFRIPSKVTTKLGEKNRADVLPVLRERAERGTGDKALPPQALARYFIEAEPANKEGGEVSHQNIETAVEPPFGYSFDHVLGVVKFDQVVGNLLDPTAPRSETEIDVAKGFGVKIRYAYERRGGGIADHFTYEKSTGGPNGVIVIEESSLKKEIKRSGLDNLVTLNTEAKKIVAEKEKEYGEVVSETRTWAGAHKVIPDAKVASVEWILESGDEGRVITTARFNDQKPTSSFAISPAQKKTAERNARVSRKRGDKLDSSSLFKAADNIRQGRGQFANQDSIRPAVDRATRGIDVRNATNFGPLVVKDSSVEGELHGAMKDSLLCEIDKVYEEPERIRVKTDLVEGNPMSIPPTEDALLRRIGPIHNPVWWDIDREWILTGYKLVRVAQRSMGPLDEFPGRWDVFETDRDLVDHPNREEHYLSVPWVLGWQTDKNRMEVFNDLVDVLNTIANTIDVLHGTALNPVAAHIETMPDLGPPTQVAGFAPGQNYALMLWDWQGAPFLLSFDPDIRVPSVPPTIPLPPGFP